MTTFRAAISDNGIPAAVLSDNGLVFTTRLAGGRGGRNGFESELARLGVEQRHSRPADLDQLQHLLDTWREDYNTTRPHRSLHGRTPQVTYTTRPKSQPAGHHAPHQRVRTDRVDTHGVVTIRHAGKLHHIGIGRTHARTHVILLIQDLHIRVIHAITGEILRELTLDTTRDYQAQKPRQPEP